MNHLHPATPEEERAISLAHEIAALLACSLRLKVPLEIWTHHGKYKYRAVVPVNRESERAAIYAELEQAKITSWGEEAVANGAGGGEDTGPHPGRTV